MKSAKKLWVLMISALLLRILCCIPKIIDEDEAIFSASAAALKSPFDFFSRAIDNKPPGTVWFYWAGKQILSGYPDPRWIRFFSVSVLIAAAAFVGMLVRGLSDRRSGMLAALLTIVGTAAFHPKLLAVTNELLMLPWITAAYWLFNAPSFQNRPLFRSIVSGVLIGVASSFKQTGIVFLIPLIIATPFHLAMAAALGFAGYYSAFAISLGFADFWYWIFRYPQEVLSSARGELFSWKDGALNFAVFFAGLFPMFLFFPRLRQSARGILVSWLSASIIAIMLGRALFPHYFLLLVPPLAAWAALEYGDRVSRGWRAWWLGASYVSNILVAAIPVSALFWGTDLGYHEALASRINTLLRKDEKIWIWGGSMIPLAMSQRLHVTAFPNSRFIMPPYTTSEIRSRFELEFAQNEPELILDLHERGDNQFNYPVDTYPWLRSLLEKDYTYTRDPALPWAGFYLYKGHIPPKGWVSTPPIEKEQLALWDEVRWIFSSPEQAKGILQNPDILFIDRYLRARMALALLPQEQRGSLSPALQRSGLELPNVEEFEAQLKKQFESLGITEIPFPTQSFSWWISLAIVRMQPVAYIPEGSPN